MSRISAWILAARPQTLPAGICPVVIGSVLAFRSGYFDVWMAFFSFLAAILVQIATNLVNDYYDFKKGADTEDRLGPTRVTQAGLIPAEHVKNAFVFLFAIAGFCALYLAIRGGVPVMVIGALSILCGYLYTGGPYPLAYLGLGDVVAFIFFGPVAVAGTYYLHALYWSHEAIFLGMAPGFFSMAILAVNNLRDVEQDAVANKKTLAVRFGKSFVRTEYVVCIVLAVLIGVLGVSVYMLAVLLPAFFVMTTVLAQEGRVLNQALAATGKVLVIYTILFSILCLI